MDKTRPAVLDWDGQMRGSAMGILPVLEDGRDSHGTSGKSRASRGGFHHGYDQIVWVG
jgi:hypothetical protein